MVETFQGTPDWYGGSEGIIKKLVERARDESLARYRPYGRERIAPFSPLQQQSFRLAEREVENPAYNRMYGEAGNAIRNALGQNISETISPYLDAATVNPTTNIDTYMNPYNERVVDQIARLGNRNLQENILPNVQNKFINAGQYGSTGHQNFTNRAVRDTAEAISQAQGQALQGGYNTALQSAIGQQERNLQAGQLAGTTGAQDIRNKLIGAEGLQNLATTQQAQGLRGSAVLGQLGGQQQQQAQNAANTAYQEFQNERNYPFFQTARLNEIVRGLPVNTQQFSSMNIPQPPQASPWSQGAGLLASAAGAFNQRPPGYAKGGAIKGLSTYRHYAGGGRATPNPIQAGVNDAMDTAELKSMRDEALRLQTPQVDPFWASVARAGASIAANRQPGALAALGQGVQEGINEYHNQLGNQDKRQLQSANIMNMIDNTRRLQAERDRTHQLNLEKFGQHKKEFGMTHGIHQGQLGLAREKFEHEKNLIKGKDGSIYRLVKDEDGKEKLIPIGIEGHEGISQLNPEYEKMKSKEEAKHDVKRSEEIREQSAKQYQGIQRIDQILANLDEAKLGPGFDAREYIANASKALGIDIPSLGNPQSMLEVKKGLTQLAMESTKDFSVRPTNFELNTAMEALPKTFNSPEAARQVLQSMKVFKEFGAQQDDFKDKWEEKFGSIRKKSPNGLTFEKAYRNYADEYIWPKLKAINKKYEVKK